MEVGATGIHLQDDAILHKKLQYQRKLLCSIEPQDCEQSRTLRERHLNIRVWVKESIKLFKNMESRKHDSPTNHHRVQGYNTSFSSSL